MNAIGDPRATRYDTPGDARSVARVELARHSFDLRVHALVMLFTAVLAAYGGVLFVT